MWRAARVRLFLFSAPCYMLHATMCYSTCTGVLMRRELFRVLTFCLSLILLPSVSRAQESMYGYGPAGAEAQRNLEKEIRQLVDAGNFAEYQRQLAGHLNMAGTEGSRRNARYMKETLDSMGFDTTIHKYYVYLPHPVDNYIILHGDEPKVIRPGEAGDPRDEYSLKSMVPFSAFSPSATVRGEVVYVNYGLPADFELLKKQGVELEGKIALCRYGRTFRGSKVMMAENHGMAGIILYSDPEDDGFVRGDVYPKGRMRPEDALQRGSILYMVESPGDPLTPMVPATKNAQRIPPEDAILPGIPCMPLSYADALLLFEKLDGGDLPQAWQGGLPLRYHIGPGPLEVTLSVEADYQVREIWNTVAILPGAEEPEAWVMAGCHRDAWLHGSVDPHGGGAVILEAARAIAQAVDKHGPLKRSIVLCSWDAEEFGIIGSIEWVEEFREELTEKAVVYMNADAMISGTRFWAAATPTFRTMLDEVVRDVPGPGNEALFTSWLKRQQKAGREPEHFSFGSFGGGSDHSGFLHHIAVPCISSGFGGSQGVYHSAYDTVHFMERFGDPGYISHKAGSQLIATVLTRIANAAVVPIDPSAYAEELMREMDGFEKNHGEIAESKRKAYNEAIEALRSTSREYNATLMGFLSRGSGNTPLLQSLSGNLRHLERAFFYGQGMPGSPWYRNVLYGVSKTNGYGRVVFPGLESTLGNEEAFAEQFAILIAALHDYTKRVTTMTELLNETVGND